jgi:hypothetical protein
MRPRSWLLVAATVAAASSVAASAAQATAVQRIGGCAPDRARPTRVILACGDAALGLTRMRWTSWGGSAARGHGFVSINDCEPYCAAGTFHQYRVRVVADRPKVCQGTRVYTRVTFVPSRGVVLPQHTLRRWPTGCPI